MIGGIGVVAGSNGGDRKEDDGGVNSGVTFQWVKLLVVRGEDEVEGEVARKSTYFTGRGRVILESVEESSRPVFGSLADRIGGRVLICHKHVIRRACDERGNSAVDNRGMSTPF